MQYFGLVAAAIFIGALLFLLWGMIRWSLVSSIRTRGNAVRLRHPDPEGVTRLTGIPVDSSLSEMFEKDERVGQENFALLDGNGREWWIGSFVPLAIPDVREWRTLSRVPGIPIADDMLKGVYYVTADGGIRLQSPHEGDVEVARSVAAFRTFEVQEPSDDDA